MLAIVRHGDRTPKQKMKMKITQVCRVPSLEYTFDRAATFVVLSLLHRQMTMEPPRQRRTFLRCKG